MLGMNAITAPLGRQPWVIHMDIPLRVDPQPYSIMAMGITEAGSEVQSGLVHIDVEPAKIPPVSFHPPFVFMSFGSWCVGLTNDSFCPPLLIYGTYPDGTVVNLNRSTRITFRSQAPSIAQISPDHASLLGVSPGSTKVFFFGKYPIDVTVVGDSR